MHFKFWLVAGLVFSGTALLGVPVHLYSQQQSTGAELAPDALPEAPQPQPAQSHIASSQPAPQQTAPANGQSQTGQSQTGQSSTAQEPAGGNPAAHKLPPQPKRILGIMPNYRAVSAGVIPPPPTPREAFGIATQNSFDYSSFLFVGLTSLLAEGEDAHPQLGKGVGGFWAYSWRGFADKTDGNYWVDWIMPTAFHQDERYYSLGEGRMWKRGVYAASRVLITPNYHRKSSFNISEILGKGISQAISLSYYPSQTQTASGYAQKYSYAIGRDALTNVFREFWPDIGTHLTRRHH